LHGEVRAAIIAAVSFGYRFRALGRMSLALAASLGGPATCAPDARAEPATPAHTLYAALGRDPDERAQAERIAGELSQELGIPLRSVAIPPASAAEPEVAPAALEVLTQTERALLEARELSAELREAAALRVLAQAEEQLLAALEVPGAHAFLAEVYVQLGLCAAQLGEMGLFDTALSRALSLDPRRRLEAAEAPPALTARARALGQALDLMAPSELRITDLPEGARSWLDGMAVEASASATRVRAGTHVLVVRAPGHAPYATLLKLEPGPRAPLQVALAPLALEQARRTLAGEHALAPALPRASALARAAQQTVLLIEPSSGNARALVYRCESQGCALWLGREQGVQRARHFEAPGAAYTWLNAKAVRDEPSPTRPAWKRWPLWTGVALAVVAATTAAIWATRDPPVHERRALELDPSPLPP
jgi:hypothetical protein